MRAPQVLLLSMSLGITTGPALAAGIPDHLKCYKIRDPLVIRGIVDVDTPQFGADPGCTISKAKLFCVPATTVVQSTDITLLPVVGAPTVDDRVCYRLKCPVLPTDQLVTDQFGTRTLDLIKTSYVCTPAMKGGLPSTTTTTAPTTSTSISTTTSTSMTTTTTIRFIDNGNGTITDNLTGLMWEQKNLSNGGLRYTWAGCCNGSCGSFNEYCQPNVAAAATCMAQTGGVVGCNTCSSGTCNVDPGGWGAVTTIWNRLAQLNASGFGGHTDWRIPDVSRDDGLPQLETVLAAPYPCGLVPCISGLFGPTMATSYWSLRTMPGSPEFGWGVDFMNGYVLYNLKLNGYGVRAVRGGS